ncbi:MAG: hypothetical protein M3Q10_00530 [Chloroflexota bacterium]|nr:hypothetical protein [Chloroflexota bacterium]
MGPQQVMPARVAEASADRVGTTTGQLDGHEECEVIVAFRFAIAIRLGRRITGQ